MATLVGKGAFAAANNSAVTPALPAGLQAGDMMYVVGFCRDGGVSGSPAISGWTDSIAVGGSLSHPWIVIKRRVYQPGDTAPTLDFTGRGSGDTVAAFVFAVRGAVDQAPIIKHNVALTSGTGALMTGFTNATVNDVCMVVAAIQNDIPNPAASTFSATAIYQVNYGASAAEVVQTDSQSLNSTLGSDMACVSAWSTYSAGYVSAATCPRLSYALNAETTLYPRHLGLLIVGESTGNTYEFSATGGAELNPEASAYSYTAGPSGNLFVYSASGGAMLGWAADTAYLQAPTIYTYNPTGEGLIAGGAGRTTLRWTPAPADAVDLVTVAVNGQAIKTTQIAIRMTADETTATVTAVGDHVGAAGNMTINIIKTIDGQPVFTHQSINLPVASASRSGDRTTLTASAAGALIGGSFDPDKIQMIGSGVVRAAPDFRVTPGCRYQGAVIQSVVTTLGVNSPWFTEVRF